MPTAAVAYETRRASDYEARVRSTLAALGSPDPDGDLGTTRKYLESCEAAGIDPAVTAATIYTTVRHRHNSATVLHAAESPTREEWEVTVLRGGDSEVAIAKVAGKAPSQVTSKQVIFGGFHDDEKAQALAKKMAMAGYAAWGGPRREYTLHEAGGGKWTLSNTRLTIWHERDRAHVALLRKSDDKTIIEWWDEAVDEAIEDGFLNPRDYHGSAVAYANSIGIKGVQRDQGRQSSYRRPKISKRRSRAEDSAPCSTLTRVGASSDCEKLAKEIGPIDTDRELYKLFAPRMREEVQEVFYVACVDVHGMLCGFTEIARGQVSAVHVNVEQVLQAVLAVQPCPTAFACAHCHPSGKATPSDADKRLTDDIRAAAHAAIPNVVFMDHLIIAGGANSRDYYSFTDSKIRRGSDV